MGSESPCGRLYIFGPESICLPLYTEGNDISDSDISLLTGVTYTCVFVPLGIKGKNISAIEFSCGDEILCSSYGEDLKQRIFLADPSSNAKCKNSWYELFQSNGDDIGSRYKASFELEFPQGRFSFIFKVKDRVKKTNLVMSSGKCRIEKPEVKVPEISEPENEAENTLEMEPEYIVSPNSNGHVPAKNLSASLTLTLKSNNEETKIPLHEKRPSEVDFDRATEVIENGQYHVEFKLRGVDAKKQYKIEMHVNGASELVERYYPSQNETEEISVFFRDPQKDPSRDDVRIVMPFQFSFDYAYISVKVTESDGDKKKWWEFWSDTLHVENVSDAERVNFEKIIGCLITEKISEQENESVRKTDAAGGLVRTKFDDGIGRTFDVYMMLLDKIASFFEKNISAFDTLALTTVEKRMAVNDSRKVRRTNQETVRWLSCHPEVFSECQRGAGLSLNGRNYYVSRALSESYFQSYSLSENVQIVSFLNCCAESVSMTIDAISSIKDVRNKLNASSKQDKKKNKYLNKEIGRLYNAIERLSSSGEGVVPSVVMLKTFERQMYRNNLGKLKGLQSRLFKITDCYSKRYALKPAEFRGLPRWTERFTRSPYSESYELMRQWFRGGNALDLEDDNLSMLMNIRSLDDIYELYCVKRIRNLIEGDGFRLIEVQRKVPFSYPPCYFQNSRVDHKWRYQRDGMDDESPDEIILYFEPAVGVDVKETTGLNMTTGEGTYTPDFILKFMRKGEVDKYVVLDAKLGNTYENYEIYDDMPLKKVREKYKFDCDPSKSKELICGVLSGRVTDYCRTEYKKYEGIKLRTGRVDFNPHYEDKQQEIWKNILKTVWPQK